MAFLFYVLLSTRVPIITICAMMDYYIKLSIDIEDSQTRLTDVVENTNFPIENL